EAAHKLGLCYLQTRDVAAAIEAFSYYLQTFPDNPQVPSVLAQRALAQQQNKNYAAALADLNTILAKYPKAHEREAALQAKALIQGQQGDAKGMAETFRQLLNEFPKSSAAAQANYYLGKAAFEAGAYKTALSALNAARQLNKDQYYSLASLRIILCHFYLKDRAALTREVNNFMVNSPGTNLPPEVLEWLGIEYYNDKNFQAAEKYLGALAKSGDQTKLKPDYLFYLGDAAAKLKNLSEAEEAFSKYLQTARDAAGKAKVLLALGAVKINAHKPDEAQKIAEEIMALQPEGRVNAEARLLAGEVQLERGNFDEAAKAFKSVALLYDDPAITPRALDKAAAAFRQAGNTTEAENLSRQLHQRYPNYAGRYNSARPRPDGRLDCAEKLSRSSLLGDNRHAPWAVAHFDTTQFLAGFYIDDGYVVRCAVRRVERRPTGIERDSPGAGSHGDRRSHHVLLRGNDHHRIAAPGGNVKLFSILRHHRAHRQRAGRQLDFRDQFMRTRVDHRHVSAILARHVCVRTVRRKCDRTRATACLNFGNHPLRVRIDGKHFAFFFACDIDFAVGRINADALGFVGHFHFSARLSRAEVNDRQAGVVFVGNKRKSPVLAYGELLGVGADVPAVEQTLFRGVNYSKAIGAFVRRRAIFVQARRHARRTAQGHKQTAAIRSRMNAPGALAHLERRDNRIGCAVNDRNIAGTFITDVNKIIGRSGPRRDGAKQENAQKNYPLHI